jgi:energy-coupling factor transporter ATP-binding protein EcfA2
MFNKDEEKYLTRLIASNQVVLFLGAGFSRDATNLLNEKFPTGQTLGQKLWTFLEVKGDYDKTSLTEMYQAFLTAGVKKDRKLSFLNSNLMSSDIPDIYNEVSFPYWYKIYTVNIDDVLTKVYRRKGKGIEELKFPHDQYSERDQSLETTQIVYLNGKLPCDPDEVIFSTKQYAKANLSHQPLYAQFVYDYAAMPTIFIGTELNEPLFETYIAARENKHGLPELRPKSFLVTPELSPVKAENLRTNYNVHHVKGYTSDFLAWLESIKHVLPDRITILKKTFPNFINIYDYAKLTGVPKKSLNEFAKSFNRVPREFNAPKERSGFLMGTSPRWNDIYFELDIPRSITKHVFNSIELSYSASVNSKTKVINLTGYAGSGKSTILKRLGFMLSQNGRTAFLSYSAFVPKNDEIINVLHAIEDRVVLLFDNANNVMTQLPELIKKLNNELKNPPVIVLGIRSNYLNKLDELLDPDFAEIESFKIPDLDDLEIENLIAKLEENNLLGLLNGKTKSQRFYEFKNRANRQILIAMKEATNGKSFEEIMKDEYNVIQPSEAKILCTCISLCTEQSYPNSKQDFIGFSKIDHNQALNFLNTVLHGTIMWIGSGNQFMIRHKILADYFIKNCSSIDILKEAYIRVLSVLAPELRRNNIGNARMFNLFKALTNHQTLYRRFKNDINLAREVYDSIASYFNDDAHFWLQYGSLEVEGKDGDLKLAENYINQAESLFQNSRHIQNAKCNLYYRLAYSSETLEEAIIYKEKADALGHILLLSIGKEEPYIYHIYCGGRYNFISKWIKDKDEKRIALLDLQKIVKTAITFHPRNERLEVAANAIKRAYINLGISENLEDPEIPDFLQ